MSIKRFWPWSDESLEDKLIEAAEIYQISISSPDRKSGRDFIEQNADMESVVKIYYGWL